MAKKRKHTAPKAAKRPAKIGALTRQIKSLTIKKNKIAKKFELMQKVKRAKAALKKLR